MASPYITTTANGTFSVSSQGYTQGMVLPDPAIQNSLAAGVVGSGETVPMWGGIAIMENIPTVNTNLGGNIQRADTNAHITGFSVLDSNGSAVQSPQSPVPLANAGDQVNFFRLGSGARVPLKIDATLAASLNLGASLITTQVSWDFTNQQIIAYDAGVGALNVKIQNVSVGNSRTASYAAGTGFCTWVETGSVAICVI